MADDRIVISSEPGLTPDEIARRSFPVVFRGYDQDQVRRFLKKVGDELIEAREREKELGRALDEARGQLAHPELDEATLTAALGEETTRILRSAREAAADMRTKAEERVARMVQEADEHGERLRLEAENVLARRVEEADEAAANIRAAAEADARAVHDRVEAEIGAAKARGKEMVAEAHAVRERVIGDLARRRRAAQIQIEQLLAGRDRLRETYTAVRRTLDEVTAELERAENEARQAAEAAHRRVVAAPPDDSDLAVYTAPPPEEPMAAPEPSAEREVGPEAAPGAPEVTAAPPSFVPPEPEPAEAPRPSLVRLQPFDEEEGVRIIGPSTSVAAPAPAVPPTAGTEPRHVVVGAAQPPASASVEEHHEGSVDDLFARLRAERQAAVTKAEEVLATPAPEDAQEADVAPASKPAAADDAAEVEAEQAKGVVEGEEAEDVEADDQETRERRAVLDRRDECIEPAASDIVRRLKRVLQDEQNEILDRLRQSRGRGRAEDALPSAADQAGRYRDAASAPLADAARAGAAFGGAPAVDVPTRDWAQALADELVGGLRERISRSLEADGDGTDAAESLGAAYRQWKTERIDQIARHHIAVAFNAGVLAGAPDGAVLRWVFGDPGPCPDCDDNALAGPTPKGEVYPTGQEHPPAHAGCGCLLVVVPG